MSLARWDEAKSKLEQFSVMYTYKYFLIIFSQLTFENDYV